MALQAGVLDSGSSGPCCNLWRVNFGNSLRAFSMHPAVEMRIDKILGQPERVPDVYLRYTLQEALQKGERALALMP